MSERSFWRRSTVNTEKIACAIEVGSSTTKCIIAGLTRGERKLDVLGAALTASQGIRDGEINSVEYCQNAVEKVLRRAQMEADLHVTAAVIGLSGSQIGVRIIHGDHSLEKIHAALLGDGQASLNIAQVSESEETQMRRALTVSVAQVEILSKVVMQAGPAPRFMGAGPLAIAYAALTDDQWQSGAAIIDMGARHTTLSLVGQGQLKLVRIIPIGGRHITLDLAHGIHLSAESAERLKFASGAYFTKAINNDPLELEASKALTPVRVKPSSAIDLIAPRVEEIFELIGQELDSQGEGSRLPVILVGGGASLKGVKEVARRVLGKNVRIRHEYAPAQSLHRRPVFANVKGLAKMAFARGNNRSMVTQASGAGAWAAKTAQWVSGRGR